MCLVESFVGLPSDVQACLSVCLRSLGLFWARRAHHPRIVQGWREACGAPSTATPLLAGAPCSLTTAQPQCTDTQAAASAAVAVVAVTDGQR